MKYNVLTTAIVLILLFTSFFVTSITVPQVKAAFTVYIKADGSIDPITAPIITADNVTYVFADNISDSIVVERNNVIIDGSGFTIQGDGSGSGLSLSLLNNVTIKNFNIIGFYYGLYLNSTNNSVIYNNNITANSYDAIFLLESSQNSVSSNNIINNGNDGIKLSNSSNTNKIFENLVKLCTDDGIQITECSSNNISSNFIDENNDIGIYVRLSQDNEIIQNNITGNRYGVWLFNSQNTFITENKIETNNLYGVWLDSSLNNNMRRNTIEHNLDGVYIFESSGNILSENNITQNSEHGIWLFGASNNTILKNEIQTNTDSGIYSRFSARHNIIDNILKNNYNGIYLSGSSNNSLTGNTLENNYYGIQLLFGSSNNRIFHNNIINNTIQISSTSPNTWDNTYEGNYWDDYIGVDTNLDGIGDTEKTISIGNTDGYPLMGPYTSFTTQLGVNVYTISDSTINNFQYSSSPSNSSIIMQFSNSTASQTSGFCRICIPYSLMTEPYNVTIDGQAPIYVNYTLYDDGLKRWIYFIYNHSTIEVIIQGFPDDEPPDIIVLSPENITYNIKNVPLTFYINEPTSWIAYSLNDQENITIYGNITLLDLSDGIYSIIIFARDASGNENSSSIVHFAVNTIPPDITIISPETQTYASSSVSLTFYIDEATSWIGYSLDGQANVTVGGNTTLLGLSEGSHSVVVFANDSVGNMGGSGVVYFGVDTTLPDIVIVSPENRTYASSSVSLTFTLDKPVSWIGYSLDNQVNTTITGNTTLSDLFEGTHHVVVYANSSVGKMGLSDTIYFIVDTIQPNITLVTQDPQVDNVYPQDSVKVNATVTDQTSGVQFVSINYTTNSVWYTSQMELLEGNIWNGTIPALQSGTNVTYIIIAQDKAGNTITTQVGYEYQYPVIPEFYALIILPLAIAILIVALTTKKKIST